MMYRHFDSRLIVCGVYKKLTIYNIFTGGLSNEKFVLLMISIFVIVLTGCTQQQSTSSTVSLAYKNVLENKAEFITTVYAASGTKTIYLDQLLNDGTYNFLNFAVLDMDGDKIPENRYRE